MTKPLLFIICLWILANTIAAQPPAEKEIRDLLTTQAKAWNEGSLEAFMQAYWNNDSLLFIGKSGVTYGYRNTLNNYRSAYADTQQMGTLRYDILHVKKLSNMFYHVTGKWMLQRTVSNLEGHFTLLFRRIKGKWLIVSDHSS